MTENNTEYSLKISFMKSLVRQNFVRSGKIYNSVRPMSDKTLKYFDSTVEQKKSRSGSQGKVAVKEISSRSIPMQGIKSVLNNVTKNELERKG